MDNVLIREEIDGKSIIWFATTNKYIVVEHLVADILISINHKIHFDIISNDLSNSLNIPLKEASNFINDVYINLYKKNTSKEKSAAINFSEKPVTNYKALKFYKIGNLIFRIDYQSDFEEYLIHPKFSHLEIPKTENFTKHYQIYTENENTILFENQKFIGVWHRKDIHYFQGKFSMLLVQMMHQKPEDEWLGVFHASGLANDKKAILLLGDSGNGKSTSLSILQANGLTCLADDFVPVDTSKQHVHTFPSAISIKRNSLPVLLPLYPELENTAEFHFKRLQKIVRFLPPNNSDYNLNLPCNDIVFIKYIPNSNLDFKVISKVEAFQQLVPDSWISSNPENVTTFLSWFKHLNCYQLSYSNNNKMVETIKNILNDDI